MASLIEVRDMLALQGRMEAAQLSVQLHTPQALVDAMLSRFPAVVKAARKEKPAYVSGGRCVKPLFPALICRREQKVRSYL